MKFLRLSLPLLLLISAFAAPGRAQSGGFVPLPLPVPFVTATDAVFFAQGFLAAEQDIRATSPDTRIFFQAMADINRGVAALCSRAGSPLVALYFYGRALRFEWAAYEAGELSAVSVDAPSDGEHPLIDAVSDQLQTQRSDVSI